MLNLATAAKDIFEKTRYGGLSRQSFEICQNFIAPINEAILRKISTLALTVCYLMLFISCFIPDMKETRVVYICFSLTYLAIFYFSFQLTAQKPRLTLFLFYCFLGVAFLYGIILGITFNPNNTATSFVVFLVVLPLFITDKPYRIGGFLCASTLVFCLCSCWVKPKPIATQDAVNTVAFLVLSLFTSYYVLQLKLNGIIRLKQLEEKNEELSAHYKAVPGGVFRRLADGDGKIIYANDDFCTFLGYTADTIAWKGLTEKNLEYVPSKEDIQPAEYLRSMHEGTETGEHRYVCADGTVKWVWVVRKPMTEHNGTPSIFCAFSDITALKEVQEQAQLNQDRYEVILRHTKEILFEWNIRGGTLSLSQLQQERIFMTPSEDFQNGEDILSRVHSEDVPTLLGIYDDMRAGVVFSVGEVRLLTKKKGYVWYKISATCIKSRAGLPVRAVGLLSDISIHKKQLQQAQQDALADPLTKLLNTSALKSFATQNMQPETPSALILLDVDNFKAVNDTYGHIVGDRLLTALADRLRAQFRATDGIGRVGGDEFAIFMTSVPNSLEMQNKLQKLSSALAAPVIYDGMKISFSSSIGVAFYPEQGISYEELYRNADSAMYAAKKNGKNQFCLL